MKRTIFIFLLNVLFTISSSAQRIYSEANLKQASREELNAYLKTSQKSKKTGTILSISGPATIAAGLIVFVATRDDDAFIGYTTGSDIGGWMIVTGMGATVVGVPILITGSSRVTRITKLMNENPLSFKIVPSVFQNYLCKNYQFNSKRFNLNFFNAVDLRLFYIKKPKSFLS